MAIFGLFLLPFAAVGTAIAGAGAWRSAQGHWREGLPLLLVGVVFAGFAAVGLAVMVVGRRKIQELEQIQAMHPDRPWLWRRDWALGRIKDSSRAMVGMSWVFAVFWNLVSVPIGFVAARTAVREANPKLYLALLFPLVGCGLLVWAVRLTLRNLKYGTSSLELSTNPGSIGRGLSGSIRIPSAVRPEGGFDVTLTCVRRITTRGKNSSTSERILWQEESRVRGEPTRDAAGSGVRVPVSFRIPSDAMASDSSNSRDQIVWRLTLSANVPGVDYHSSFEVPVFRTGEVFAEADVLDQPPPRAADYRQPPGSRITVTRTQRGTEIFFGPARNPGVAVGWTIFTILWAALLPLLISWDAPLLFHLVFGAFTVLLVIGLLQQWLGVSRVHADSVGVTVASGYIAPGRERTVETPHIADISTKIGMQAGTTPYYDVVIVRKGGKRIVVGRSVRDKREAEWLVQTLKAVVGLTEPGATASSRP
jgi:hypothetical protein